MHWVLLSWVLSPAAISSSPKLFLGLQLAGCALMVWFGYKSWNAPVLCLHSTSQTKGTEENKKDDLKILSSAALLQLTNPMLIVFLLSLMPQFVDQTQPYFSQLTILITIFVLTCWMVHILYSYSVAFAASRWMNARFSLILNRISAILFWLISVSVAIKLLWYKI